MEYRFSDRMAALKPSLIREILKNDPSIIPFAAGNPDPASFPIPELRRLADDLFDNHGAAALQYGVTEGYGPLREQVKARLHDKFGIGTDSDEVLITSGGQQALDLASKVLCNEGDVMLCESPSFIGALNSYRAHGIRLRGVTLEEDGLDVDMLARALDEEKNAKLLYIIPTFQNPAGLTTSLEKRKKIYELCAAHGVMILEDNPYGELRFAGRDIPTLKSFDTEGIVIYCGTFSKILSAGMRVGFCCLPKPVAAKVTVAKQVNDVHTNLFFQMLVSNYMAECDLDAHIAHIRAIYREKCGAMLSAMERSFLPSVTFTRPEGGIFLWCTLPESVDMLSYCRACTAAGVSVVPGMAFEIDESAVSHSFRMNYSTPTLEQIGKGVSILADVQRQMFPAAE